MAKNWSIIIVNYKSHIYLKWQFKIMYEANDPADFRIIIVDNSVDEDEKKELDKTVHPFKEAYQNIEVIYHIPKYKAASGQHGEAIDLAKKLVDTKYTLVHDPDFFWLKPNYLNWMAKILSVHDAFGAPYTKPVGIGQKYFPSAFGCAYVTEKIKNVSFEAYIDGDIEKSWETFRQSKLGEEGYDFYYDVGWKVREKLSKENDENFVTFGQNNIRNGLINLLHLKSSHSFQTLTTIYSWNHCVIAAHLFRGTFTGKVKSHCDPQMKINQEQYEIRDRIGKLMYEEAKNGCIRLNKLKSEISGVLLFKLSLLKFLLFLKKKKFGFLLPLAISKINKKIDKLR